MVTKKSGEVVVTVVTPSNSPAVITAVYVPGPIALDPADPAWSRVPETAIELGMRLNEVGARMSFEAHEVRRVKVKAVHNGTDIFFFFQWNESTASIAVDDYPIFADAFAMEIPLFTEDSLLCMGTMDKPVNIIFWRADLSRPENIVSGGAGTPQTSPDAASQNIRHYQKWASGVWSVILARPMAAASENQVSFVRGASKRISFANWKGGTYAERGGHKIISGFQNLSIQ